MLPNHHLVTPNQSPTQTQQILLCQLVQNCCYSTATSTSIQLQLSHHLPTTFPLQGHSQINPSSLPHCSQITLRSFPGHSQILGHHQFIPSSFLVHSQIIPRPIQVRSQVISNLLPDFFYPVQRCLYRFIEYSSDSDFMVDLVSWTHQHIKILKPGGPEKAASFPSYGNSRLRKSWK